MTPSIPARIHRLRALLTRMTDCLAARARHIADSFDRPPADKKSLRLRLCLFFSLFLVAAWLTAAVFAWKQCQEYINEFFDTQQLLFAKRLAVTDFTGSSGDLPKNKRAMPGAGKDSFENLENEAIGFAVFTLQGEKIMSDGEKGRRFIFEPGKIGFSNTRLAGKKDVWRIVWMPAADGRHRIAVGQEMEYRREMAFAMLGKQIGPWLFLLPVLLLGLSLLLSRELAPLRAIAAELHARSPDNTAALDVKALPSEVLPMAESLNAFFLRTKSMLARERSFVSDAAHELRTPLAGLHVQAQIAARQGISLESRNEAIHLLQQGTERCARLVDQLLALSRLDALDETDAKEGNRAAGLAHGPIIWSSILEELMDEYRPKAEARAISLDSQIISLSAMSWGIPVLAAMLVRNILENAVKYTPDKGYIHVTQESSRLVICNSCTALPESYISRLGERFFRPPGQQEPGSGLGLSIAKKIADIHHFSMEIRQEKAMTDGCEIFQVSISWRNPKI